MTHGMTGTKIYSIWTNMKQRCQNQNHPRYREWGGRGITVCDRWQEFGTFYEDMGTPPAGLTLDRINNDGNYEPGNCRWATWNQQMNNQREFKRGAKPKPGKTVTVKLSEEQQWFLNEIRWTQYFNSRSDAIRHLIDAEAARLGISIDAEAARLQAEGRLA